MEGVFSWAEEVLEEVGGYVGVQPEKTGLAVVDEICTAVFDAGEGGADGRGENQVAGLRRGEAGLGWEGVDGNYAGI